MALALPCPKEEDEAESPLCTRLFQLWSLGLLSATQVAELCPLTMLSGCNQNDLVAMAKCGSFGQQKGNCHRDMLALHCKHLALQAHLVRAPVKDPKSQNRGTEEVALLLPHMVFATHEGSLRISLPCRSVGPSGKVWKRARTLAWRTKGKVDAPTRTVPLFIHGDGCEFQTRDSLMTWSWGSLLSRSPSLSSHILLTAVPKSCTLTDTWDPLDAWISWSFTALPKGMHPDRD